MPSWILKAVIQGALSRLPEPQRYNRLLQKYVTGSLHLSDDYFFYKWQQCKRQTDEYFKYRPDADPAFVALELGTGWFPITPIGFALQGAKLVYSIDTRDLLSHEQVVDTLKLYRRMSLTGRIEVRRADTPELLTDLLERADRLSARQLLDALGIKAVVADARDSGLPDRSIDLLCSNNTLEHIPRGVIVNIHKEFARLASEDALMVHFIDMADHYANFDKSISVYNFLRYSERAWSLFNNELQYLNRLRISDFRNIFAETGFVVVDEDNRAEPKQLDKIPIAKAFQHYHRDDLAVYETWMICEMAP